MCISFEKLKFEKLELWNQPCNCKSRPCFEILSLSVIWLQEVSTFAAVTVLESYSNSFHPSFIWICFLVLPWQPHSLFHIITLDSQQLISTHWARYGAASLWLLNWTLERLAVAIECVKVPMPAHQVLPLAEYIFEASYSTSATQANKI